MRTYLLLVALTIAEYRINAYSHEGGAMPASMAACCIAQKSSLLNLVSSLILKRQLPITTFCLCADCAVKDSNRRFVIKTAAACPIRAKNIGHAAIATGNNFTVVVEAKTALDDFCCLVCGHFVLLGDLLAAGAVGCLLRWNDYQATDIRKQ